MVRPNTFSRFQADGSTKLPQFFDGVRDAGSIPSPNMGAHMTSAEIVDAYTAAKETLGESGIEDDFFLDLLASRLLVERIGETNNQDWWESRVLSETGRARLSEVTPKTQMKSRISLALEVGHKAESDRLPDDSISLFYFGPQVETRLTAAIEEIEGDNEPTFEALENLSIQSLDKGWTDEIILATESNISPSSDSGSLQHPGSDESFLLDTDGYTQDEIESEKWRLLSTLLRGYGYSTNRLQVPYYTMESGLKPENA